MQKHLLIENNETNRDMLSRRLEQRGFRIAIAVDGAKALALTQSEKPALALMDMRLPVMDGWTATRTLDGTKPVELARLPDKIAALLAKSTNP